MSKRFITICIFCITCLFAQAQQKEKIYTHVEQPPTYDGGEEALAKYLLNNIHGGTDAEDMAWFGTVFVKFVVDSKGQVKNVRLANEKNAPEKLAKEIIRIVKAMPTWNPGKQNGKPVSVEFVLPVRVCPQSS